MATELECRCQEALAQHGRSFRWAQLFLNPRQRRDAALTYAFCRWVDDGVDDAPNAQQAHAHLDAVQAMLDGIGATPLVAAYVELCERCGVGIEPARDLVRGMQSDLAQVRISDEQELGLYCYRVAGTVGLMMCGVLGVSSPAARRHAVALGVAMQLTNICRDVLDDAERDRVYLPLTSLKRHELDPGQLLSPSRILHSPSHRRRVAQVCVELLDQAELAYAEGLAGLHYLPTRARWAIAVAAHLYRGIGRRLVRCWDADPFRGRMRVPWPEKCWLAVRGLASAFTVATSRKRLPSAAARALPLPLPTLPS
ncbi:MAG TPA: phytoene/squalene synthase family protein [Polyangiaceae bacterium]|nr:phytoene/squalene synthase family protein [Polyangiaceae bacterium]